MKTFSAKEVIIRLKESLGVNTDTELANILGITKAAISNWKNRNTIDWNLVFSKCEHTSFDWLIDGRELNDEITSKSVAVLETRPRIPFDASAGFLSEIVNGIYESQCEMLPIVSRFPRYDFTILVRGNSMEPEFVSGDEIACRFVNERSFIQWGRPHVLDTAQGVVLKRIYERRESILCRSDNKDFEDFEIPKSDILHIALVVGSLRVY